MKKMICILLVISMLTLVFAFEMGAVSYSIAGISELRGGSHGGSCYDYSDGSQGNAWAYDPNGFNSVQLEHDGGSEWFDHGYSLGDIADVYSSKINEAPIDAYRDFSYYAWANYVRK